jgi:hypothetical protein
MCARPFWQQELPTWTFCSKNMQHQLLGKGTASLENKEIVSLSSQIAIT